MRHSWDWITTGRTVTHTNNYPPLLPTATATLLPSGRQIHKYTNRRVREHMGIGVSAGTHPPLPFFSLKQTHTHTHA